jgi:metallo-beta-lactamase class B
MLGPELKIHIVEPGVFLVVHRFPGCCNSLIVQCAENDFVWVDTPLTNAATEQVHRWLCKTYSDPNNSQINTGFHNDNLAGNGYLIEKGIECYGSDLTVKLLEERWHETVQQVLPYYQESGERYRDALVNGKMVSPSELYPLKEGLSLEIGNESVQVYFPGPSHTQDNVVVYFKNRQILFGGCMIRGIESKGLGFTGDADIAAWPTSVQKVLEKFPDTRIVVPGHGPCGNLDLIRHTISLCKP